MRSLLTMGFNVQLKHDAEETSREDHGWVAVHDEARCSPFRASACAAVRRALLTSEGNPGSLYRCCRST